MRGLTNLKSILFLLVNHSVIHVLSTDLIGMFVVATKEMGLQTLNKANFTSPLLDQLWDSMNYVEAIRPFVTLEVVIQSAGISGTKKILIHLLSTHGFHRPKSRPCSVLP